MHTTDSTLFLRYPPDGDPGVFCCGLRVVSVDGSVTDVPDSKANDEHFGRPSNQARDGASVPAAGQVPAPGL